MLKTELRQVCHELTSFSRRDAYIYKPTMITMQHTRIMVHKGFSIFPAWCWKWSTWTVKSVRHQRGPTLIVQMAICSWTAGGFQVHISWFNLQRRNWCSHTFPLTLRKPSRKVLECGSIMVFLFFSGSSWIFPGSFLLFTILCISWVPSSFTLCTPSGGGFSSLPQVRWADVDFLECFPAVFPAVVLLFICLWICLF